MTEQKTLKQQVKDKLAFHTYFSYLTDEEIERFADFFIETNKECHKKADRELRIKNKDLTSKEIEK